MTSPTAQTIFERIATSAHSAATRLRVRSALNPMLWLCGIVSLPCFLISYYAHGLEPLSSALVVMGSLPIVATVLAFLYFAIAAPEKLQSEDYQIRHETLELIKEKGVSIDIAPSSLDAITNPSAPRLPRGGGR